MLRDIGFCVESADIGVIFYHFDVNIDGWIDRDEFIFVLQLTGYELDLALDEMKACLTAKVVTYCIIQTCFFYIYLNSCLVTFRVHQKTPKRTRRTFSG